jgi:uncharacterized membrane protein SpoIIM required for sporulation
MTATPRQFELAHAPAWAELEALLGEAEAARAKHGQWDAARLAALYRSACEQLALAQARAYPIHLVQRLEVLTQRAHRLIYRRQGLHLDALARLFRRDFPRAVRAHGGYVAAAAALFVLPMLALGWASWRDPGFILHLLDAATVQRFDSMYGPGDNDLGRTRDAETDWQMFGFYILNNIGVGFQCFASGIFAGIGSAFFLFFNGLFAGAVAGFLVARGHGENFLSFVVTHSAFELTAIVLAGAAGLRLGHAWIAPGRLTRLQALRAAAREAVVVVYGVVGMLVLAAAVEAFWSSARWIAPQLKYGVGTGCWLAVFAYLGLQGRDGAGSRDAG